MTLWILMSQKHSAQWNSCWGINHWEFFLHFYSVHCKRETGNGQGVYTVGLLCESLDRLGLYPYPRGRIVFSSLGFVWVFDNILLFNVLCYDPDAIPHAVRGGSSLRSHRQRVLVLLNELWFMFWLQAFPRTLGLNAGRPVFQLSEISLKQCCDWTGAHKTGDWVGLWHTA